MDEAVKFISEEQKKNKKDDLKIMRKVRNEDGTFPGDDG
jgi:hypothetical protein